MKNYSKYIAHSWEENEDNWEKKEWRKLYLLLFIQSNTELCWPNFHHIFLLFLSVLCSHPLTWNKIDLSLQWSASSYASSYLKKNTVVLVWAHHDLGTVFTASPVYQLKCVWHAFNHNRRQPFNSELSLVWMKAFNWDSCQPAFLHLIFLICTCNSFGPLQWRWGGCHFLLKMLWLWGILYINQ